MGISRSGSTVIAYAMKQQRWPLDVALAYVKERRSIIKPNEAFMKQLQTYDGILKARSDTRVCPPGQQGNCLKTSERILIYCMLVWFQPAAPQCPLEATVCTKGGRRGG